MDGQLEQPARRKRRIPVGSSACMAPSVELHLSTDGSVRPCCIAGRAIGRIPDDSLLSIWGGHERAALVDELHRGRFPGGCEGCAAEVAIEGRENAYPAIFDERAARLLTDPSSGAYPTWLELNLSNACNLQCIQCDGELSSAIRTHRERRRPMPRAYGDAFFDELRDLLPHLEVIQFAGGEPFLASENYRVWDMVAEEAPGLLCIVITNGTQWSPRVERAMQRVRMGFTLSIDGASRETFEAVRVGADFDQVMTNVGRFLEHARREETPFSVNHCLMPQNHHEFGDLLLWAEDLGVDVNVSVVRGPGHCTIAALDPAEIRRVHERLLVDQERVRPGLRRNRDVWDREVARIAAWAATDRDDLIDTWYRSRYAEVLGLSGKGSGPYDDRAARSELATHADDGLVHWIDVGPDDAIRATSAGFGRAFAQDHDPLGMHVESMREWIADHFGGMQRYEVLGSTADRIDAEATCRDASVRLCIVAMRDAAGRAECARMLIASHRR